MSLLFSNNPTDDSTDGRHDFDFFHGSWHVRHRRLRHRLVDETQWDEFDGTAQNQPIIGGLGNIDDNLLALPSGTYRAATIRLFDPTQASWSIWWIDGRRMGLEPPVTGRFMGGIGTFFGDDVHQDIPVKVRFVWSNIGPHSAQWEQAFSPDGGNHWEINWTMRFTRTP